MTEEVAEDEDDEDDEERIYENKKEKSLLESEFDLHEAIRDAFKVFF